MKWADVANIVWEHTGFTLLLEGTRLTCIYKFHEYTQLKKVTWSLYIGVCSAGHLRLHIRIFAMKWLWDTGTLISLEDYCQRWTPESHVKTVPATDQDPSEAGRCLWYSARQCLSSQNKLCLRCPHVEPVQERKKGISLLQFGTSLAHRTVHHAVCKACWGSGELWLILKYLEGSRVEAK